MLQLFITREGQLNTQPSVKTPGRKLLQVTFWVVLVAPCGLAQVQAAKESAPAKVAFGSYECWANGSARALLNFAIRSPSKYTDTDGQPGAYSYDQKTGAITFKGGGLDGVMPAGFYSIYHEPKGIPTVSFRSPRNAEASFCEKAR